MDCTDARYADKAAAIELTVHAAPTISLNEIAQMVGGG
jgi:hypothetical protein